MKALTIKRRYTVVALAVAVLAIPLAAYAGSVFEDVDDNNPHINGITFMKDSGVSIGCDGDNNYCPNDFVTRAQMGTFMYRLSGNDPLTDPSVNADKVDDLHANELIRVAFDSETDDALTGVTLGDALTVEIVAPTAGFLVVTASADVYGTADDFLTCSIWVDGDQLAESNRALELDPPDAGEQNCATNAVYTTVFGGDHVVDFYFAGLESATTTVDEASMHVLFIPFNGTGAQPTLPILLDS